MPASKTEDDKKSKNAHKLLILTKLRSLRKYRRFLVDAETPSALESICVMTITNIGDKVFPGGKMDLRFRRPTGIGEITGDASVNLSPLKSGDSAKINVKWTPSYPGVWILNAEINPQDKAEVEYFIEKKKSVGKISPTFFAIDKHQLDIKIMLEKLLKKVI